MNTEKKPVISDLLISLLIAAGFFTLYLSFLSKSYVFEGLARALPIDTGRFNHLFPGNYLLYGILGQGFHRVLQALGARNPAYLSLQILDTVYGACGLGVFYISLRRLAAGQATAALWSCVLGVTLGYWLWSTDAENYIFSTLLLQFLFLGLVREIRASTASPARVGLLHGLACLGHIVNVMMILPCLWILLYRPKISRVKILRTYLLALTSVAGGAYAFTIAFIKHLQSPRAVFEWLLGSASGGTDSLMHWHGVFTRPGVLQWLKMTVHILVASSTAYRHPPPMNGSVFFITLARLCVLFLFGLLILKFKTLMRQRSAETVACLLWLFSYALIFTSWEPGTMVYRVSDLIPIITLFFLASRTLPSVAISAAFVCIGLANFSAEIYPRSFLANNPGWVRMQLVKAATQENDWIAVEGGTDELYVPYFAQRRPFLVGRFQTKPDKLTDALITLNRQGQRVFVTSRLLEDPQWKTFFQSWTLREAARDHDGYVLYLVRANKI